MEFLQIDIWKKNVNSLKIKEFNNGFLQMEKKNVFEHFENFQNIKSTN